MQPASASIEVVALWILLLATGAKSAEVPVLHELIRESSYSGTCDVPCPGTDLVVDCAVLLVEGVQGTFVLTFLRDNGPFLEFQVTDVAWTVPFAPPLEVMGSGTYALGTEVPIMHRLVLDLKVGDTRRARASPHRWA